MTDTTNPIPDSDAPMREQLVRAAKAITKHLERIRELEHENALLRGELQEAEDTLAEQARADAAQDATQEAGDGSLTQ